MVANAQKIVIAGAAAAATRCVHRGVVFVCPPEAERIFPLFSQVLEPERGGQAFFEQWWWRLLQSLWRS